MIDLDDSIKLVFKSGSKILYHCYCDMCNSNRGYLSRYAHEKSSLCKSCTKINKNAPNNVDIFTFKITNNKATFLTYCKECGNYKGFRYKRDFLTSCISCVQKGKVKSLDTRVKISCTKQNINIDDFNGFKQDENTRFRKLFNSLGLHNACFKLYDFTCQKCNTRGGNLNAHHIVPWYKDSTLRFTIDNLICLCQRCHYQFHSINGKDSSLELVKTFIKGD